MQDSVNNWLTQNPLTLENLDRAAARRTTMEEIDLNSARLLAGLMSSMSGSRWCLLSNAATAGLASARNPDRAYSAHISHDNTTKHNITHDLAPSLLISRNWQHATTCTRPRWTQKTLTRIVKESKLKITLDPVLGVSWSHSSEPPVVCWTLEHMFQCWRTSYIVPSEWT